VVAYSGTNSSTINNYTLQVDVSSDSAFYNATTNTSTVYYTVYLSSGANSFSDYASAAVRGSGNITQRFDDQLRSLGQNSSTAIFSSAYTVTHNSDGSAIATVDAYYVTAGQIPSYAVRFTSYTAAATITLFNAVRQPTTPTLTVTRPKAGTAATGTTIRLEWTASTPPSGTAANGTGNGTSAISWYEYRYSTDNATWTTYNLNNVNGLGTTRTADFGPTAPITVVPGTVYYFQVRAYASNSEGYGPWSASRVAYAAPTITSVTSVGTTASVVVAAPSSNGGSAISSYTVEYSTDSGFGGTPSSVTIASPGTATITGLLPGRTYYFRARYTNAASVTSPYTATSSAFISAYGRRYATSGSITNVTTTARTATITSVFGTEFGTDFTTSAAHGFSTGQTVIVSGIAAPYDYLNQTYTNVSVFGVDSFSTGANNEGLGTVSISGTAVSVGAATYTASNEFSAGNTVTITGVNPSAYNLTNATITSATASQFVITSSAQGTYSSSTGTAVGWVRMLTGQRYVADTGSGSPGWVTIATAQKFTAGAWTPFS